MADAPGALAASGRSTRDAGFTFVEVLVTIVLLGTVVLSVVVATQTLIVTSRTSREAARVESALISAAERVERAPRETFDCDMGAPVNAAAGLEFGLDAAAVAPFVQVTSSYLASGGWQPGYPASGCRQGLIVQKFEITITSPDNGLARTLEVVKGDA